MKDNIRKQMIDRRKAMDFSDKQLSDQIIVSLIRADERYQSARHVAIFYPMLNEIDLLDLLQDDKLFLFPKVEDKNIVFYPYEKDMRFLKSAFGVKEPQDGIPFLDKIDYMVVPALAIDKENHRLGYGKGFYDRFLASNRPKTTIGVIYTFQLVDHIEISSFDETLDGYIKG